MPMGSWGRIWYCTFIVAMVDSLVHLRPEGKFDYSVTCAT
jgi:hypothetical protein